MSPEAPLVTSRPNRTKHCLWFEPLVTQCLGSTGDLEGRGWRLLERVTHSSVFSKEEARGPPKGAGLTGCTATRLVSTPKHHVPLGDLGQCP